MAHECPECRAWCNCNGDLSVKDTVREVLDKTNQN